MSIPYALVLHKRKLAEERERARYFRAVEPKPVMRLAKGRKAQMLADFERLGHSGRHSHYGTTVCLFVNHCMDNGIPFRLTYLPKRAFAVEIINPETFEPRGPLP